MTSESLPIRSASKTAGTTASSKLKSLKIKPQKPPPGNKNLPKKGCCHSISKKILQTYQEEPEKLVFLQRTFFTAAGIFSAIKLKEVAAPLRLVPIIFITPHDCRRVKNRLFMAKSAAKLGKKSDCFFYAIKTIDASADVLSAASSLTQAALQLSGYAQMALIGVIFTVVLPKFFLATSLIGLTGDIWSLTRTVSAYREFCRRKGNEQFVSIIEALEFAKQGKPLPSHIKDPILRTKVKAFSDSIHREHCFRSGESQQKKNEQIDAFFKKVEPLLDKDLNFLESLNTEVFGMAAEAITFAFNQNLKSGEALQAIQECHKKILEGIENHPIHGGQSEIRKKIAESRKAFHELLKEAQTISHDIEREFRRIILNNIVVLLIDLLFLASSITTTDSHSEKSSEDANIWSMTACLLQMSLILFEGKVTDQDYKKLDDLFFKSQNETFPSGDEI